MGPSDTVRLRDAQAQLVGQVSARANSGQPVTVAVMSPGAGKSLSAIACHIAGVRGGWWRHMVWLSPRLNLAGQAEADWRKWSPLFDRPPGPVLHRTNGTSLTPGHASGYISTYQSLAASPAEHVRWMRHHRGLLVLDEAHALGVTERDGGDSDGTEAAKHVATLMESAAHTIVMSGTPYRSDGQTIVGAEPFYVESRGGRQRLVPHVSYTYGQGVADGVLRPFQADLLDAKVTIEDDNGVHVRRLSYLRPGELSAAVRSPLVYEPILDRVVSRLDHARNLSRRLSAIVLAVDQQHARSLARYLDATYPDLRVGVATSADNVEAKRVLDGTKRGAFDVLVAVGMVHVGYDAPAISVVGLLTNVRHHGWLEQAVGRGLRIWSGAPADRQTCFVVGPADPDLARWAETMRTSSATGTAARPPVDEPVERAAREPTDRTVREVVDVRFDGGRVYGSDASGAGDLTVAQADQMSLLADTMAAPSESAAAAQLRHAGTDLADVLAPADMTVAEARQQANKQVRGIVGGWAARNGARRGKIALVVKDAHQKLNRAQGVTSSSDLVTLEQCEERVRLARERWGTP